MRSGTGVLDLRLECWYWELRNEIGIAQWQGWRVHEHDHQKFIHGQDMGAL